MNIIKVSLFVMVLISTLTSCLKTEAPTPNGVLTGEWIVENVISNELIADEDLFYEGAKLHLDNNDSFLFLNVDGRATSGNWIATDSVLTLNGNDNSIREFNVVYVDWNKLQMYRTLTISTGNEVEIRYLFTRSEE